MGVGSQARSVLAFGCAFDPAARLPREELTLDTFTGVGCELRNPVRTSTRCILGGANGRCAASGSSEAALQCIRCVRVSCFTWAHRLHQGAHLDEHRRDEHRHPTYLYYIHPTFTPQASSDILSSGNPHKPTHHCNILFLLTYYCKVSCCFFRVH